MIDLKRIIDDYFGRWELSDLKFTDFIIGAGIFITCITTTLNATTFVTNYIQTVMNESQGEIIDKFIPCAEAICIEEDRFEYCISFDFPKKARLVANRNYYKDTYVVKLMTQGRKSCVNNSQ